LYDEHNIVDIILQSITSTMSSLPSRRSSSRRSNMEPLFPKLRPPGVKMGLERLVTDNAKTVAKMLQSPSDKPADLCEQCAKILQQQQLSPASFLARFFDAKMLAIHAELLGKSPKGTAPTLAERISGEWAKNKPIPDTHPKRKAVYEEVEDLSPKKKTKAEKSARDKSNDKEDQKTEVEPTDGETKIEKELQKDESEKELPKEEKAVKPATK
jgi:hypothetical protein